jgi:hypothetical protein
MFTRIATTTLLLIAGGTFSTQSPSTSPEKSCREHPQLIGKCFSVHGRLSVYNGNPAFRIWRIGTKRVLGVSDQRFALPEYRNIPEELAKQLDGENEILGDFLVCPFTRSRPGEMQLVCIESARNVAVRKRK